MRDDGLYKNANTGAYLQKVVHAIQQRYSQARACLLLGDITDSGSNTAYEFVQKQMQSLSMPVLATAGNHDNRDNMRSYFPSSCDDFAQSIYKLSPDWRLIVLDSKREGNIVGELCQTRLTWLKSQLKLCPEPNVLVALHHPPAPMAVPTMDDYALSHGDRLYEGTTA